MEIKYEVFPIGKDTWRISEGLVYSHLLAGEKKALLIDTGLGLGNLKEQVERLTSLPVEVVNTHGHIDHTGCNADFPVRHIHQAEREVLAIHSDPAFRRRAPARFGLSLDPAVLEGFAGRVKGLDYRYFEDCAVFDLGGRHIQAIPVSGHTPGSVCLLDREWRYLFTGDSLCDRGVLLHLDCSLDVKTFLRSMERLKEHSDAFDLAYPGHHRTPIGKEFLDDYIACARMVLSGELKGVPGESSGSPCLIASYNSIGLAYRKGDGPCAAGDR